jgi:tetratricopeptide (TPR) repeat protein
LKSRFITLAAVGLGILGIPSLASAQGGAPPIPSTLGHGSGGSSAVGGSPTGWISVYLQSETELPISAIPQMTLTSLSDTPIPQFPRLDGKAWIFSGLPIGTSYELDVKVDGFQPVHETVDIPDMDYGTANVVVTLKPIDEQLTYHPPTGQFMLAPRVQKEVQQGLRDLSSNRIPSAQKHFQKAIVLAPGNPYVNYVMGMSYVLAKQEAKAQPYLEESVSLDPNEASSLLALGTLRFNHGNYAGAVDLLSKAVKLDPSSWKSQWLLADACLRQRDFPQAREHAEEALAAGKEKADRVRLVLAEAVASMGDRAGALATLNRFLSDHPNDPDALKFRAWLTSRPEASPTIEKGVVKELPAREATVPQIEPIAVAAPQPTADLPPKPDWAPPDIDAERPFIVSGASCTLPKVLKAAAKNATRLVTDLQKFSATEEYETVEIKRDASLQRPASRTFNYMVFIEHPSSEILRVNEYRDDGVTAQEMPGKLADMGAPGLVLAFHPLLQGDFTWSCEGAGRWQKKPVWIVRFEQRGDRPSYLNTFLDGPNSYPLPLKGRAWISENSGEVMHLETDLVKPVAEIKLEREHFVIDYEAVAFPKHKVTLWLPETVDSYFQYRGHYLHQYHHFSNFKLFWTGTAQETGQRKGLTNDSSD